MKYEDFLLKQPKRWKEDCSQNQNNLDKMSKNTIDNPDQSTIIEA